MATLPTEADIDALYEVFVPRNRAVAANSPTSIPGRRRDGPASCAPMA